MCGIWGFSGRPKAAHLKAIIKRADERGGHGFGFFGITKDNRHIYHVSHGRVDVDLLVRLACQCEIGIGHSRLVTSGDMQVMNSQPVLGDGMVVVHNGNIENHRRIMYKLGYEPRTNLDSEALIPMIKNDMADINGSYLCISYDRYEHELKAYNKTLPLEHQRHGDTNYYCSKTWQVQS
jgi:glucosamine 6-phosphate synthetase-like amidotransferase/phosphosugar isomerase protein